MIACEWVMGELVHFYPSFGVLMIQDSAKTLSGGSMGPGVASVSGVFVAGACRPTTIVGILGICHLQVFNVSNLRWEYYFVWLYGVDNPIHVRWNNYFWMVLCGYNHMMHVSGRHFFDSASFTGC
jgi:hypothetical protein